MPSVGSQSSSLKHPRSRAAVPWIGVLVLAAALVLGFPTPSSASTAGAGSAGGFRHVETAQAAGVRAVFAYVKATTVIGHYTDKGKSVPITKETYTGLRVSVFRNDRLLVSQLLGAGQPAGSARGGKSARVQNIDAAPPPEALFDLYTGGAHCCFTTLIFAIRKDGSPHRIEHSWGNAGYQLLDVNGDGALEFKSADDRFAYQFTDFADSVFPIQIWNVENGHLINTTRDYPGQIRVDARSLARAYLKDRMAGDVRGILAAYVADKAVLGQIADGWRLVDRALARGELDQGIFGPRGAQYVASRRRFLKVNGYS